MTSVQAHLELATLTTETFADLTAAVAAATPVLPVLTDALEFLALVEGGRRDRIR
jgi:hypothetical protein